MKKMQRRGKVDKDGKKTKDGEKSKSSDGKESFEGKLKPLNVITLGQTKSDNINRMITITGCFFI